MLMSTHQNTVNVTYCRNTMSSGMVIIVSHHAVKTHVMVVL